MEVRMTFILSKNRFFIVLSFSYNKIQGIICSWCVVVVFLTLPVAQPYRVLTTEYYANKYMFH
jgi:hypothetical protein